ncbi:MAG: aminotransferase class I/II-fold pyridoxal phosphate-dependent enzyme [Anaerolineae bacterium]|nr:aminotransferase class I/II-fold pyridoxal phosphate-dependent enzyme [Anaerolineae bacterium]
MTASRNPATTAIHSDKAQRETKSVAPAIFQSATFFADSAEEFAQVAVGPRDAHFYARYGNPNHAQAEQVLADLEGAGAALLAGSGMGAITAAVLTFVGQGDHIVGQETLYAGTLSLLEKLLPRFGVTATLVDQTDPAAFEAAIRPETKMIIVEAPSNPLMKLTDFAAIATMARARGIITLADNTFATPVNQRPLDLGIDLVAHSATKYLGGHSDLIAGAVAGPTAMIEDIWRTSLITGASINGFDSWLLLRGMRTLALRVAQHNRNALALAQFLADHPQIEAVFYPGLESHPQHALALTQMTGFGGMLSFQVRGGFTEADRLIAAFDLIGRAASLGGYHSTIVHPAAMWAGSYTEAEMAERGVLPNLLRLSVGIEDPDDLIADVRAALDALT